MENENRYKIEQCGIEETAGFKNLIAIRDYAKSTRAMFRDLENKVNIYQNQIQQQKLEIDGLKNQLQQLQIKIYQNKATE